MKKLFVLLAVLALSIAFAGTVYANTIPAQNVNETGVIVDVGALNVRANPSIPMADSPILGSVAGGNLVQVVWISAYTPPLRPIYRITWGDGFGYVYSRFVSLDVTLVAAAEAAGGAAAAPGAAAAVGTNLRPARDVSINGTVNTGALNVRANPSIPMADTPIVGVVRQGDVVQVVWISAYSPPLRPIYRIVAGELTGYVDSRFITLP